MDWKKFPNAWPGGKAERFDPWLRWSLQTAFAGHPDRLALSEPVERVRVAAEFSSGEDGRGPLQCAGCYTGQRYVSGKVKLNELPALAKLAGLVRFRLGSPVNRLGARLTGAPVAPVAPVAVSGPIVAVIDHGFAFAHRAFRDDAGATRIHALWDQSQDRLHPGNNPNGLWKPCGEFGYGGVLSKTDIDGLNGPGPDEMQAYARARYTPAQRRISHGTHVLDLAAGHPNPMPVAAQGRPDSTAPAGRDTAAEAPILLVQLPAKPAKDTSGAALCVHVLDALHWIALHAGPRKVVVNFSDGAYAGPHDGTSLLEAAIDDFLATHPDVSFVVAAGNGYEANGHAALTVSAGETSPPMFLRALPDDSTDSFLEVWLSKGATKDVRLRVHPPGGEAIEVALGKKQRLLGSAGKIAAAVLSTRESPNASERAMFLIALSPTRLPWRPIGAGFDPRSPAPHGVWVIEVLNRSKKEVQVDAWIERDDPALGDRGPRRQAFFVDPAGAAAVHSYIKPQNTLNSVATGQRSTVVGGFHARGSVFEKRDVGNPHGLAPYSSAGPGTDAAARLKGQDYFAPSEASVALHGLLASGNRSGTKFRLSGTSVAAPIVTRLKLNEKANPASGPMASPHDPRKRECFVPIKLSAANKSVPRP